MAKVLSIEIGNSLVKIIETDLKSKSPKVYQTISFVTPRGALNDGQLANTMELGSQIRQVLLDKKIKTKQVIFTLTSSKIASREVTIPNVKENKIDSIIKANAPEYFPIDVSQYELAYQHIAMEGEGENLHRKGIVLAAPKNLLEGYIELAKSCGLNVIAFDYSSNSLYQVVKNRCKEDVELVIKVDEMVTMLTVFEDGEVALQRSISYGVDDAIDALKASGAYGVTDYASALAIMRKKVCVKRKLEYPTGEETGTDQVKTQVTMAFDNLLRGIMRVIDFYQSRNNGKKIKKGYLTGLGGDISGLSKLIGSEFDLNVVDLVKIDGFDIEHNFPDGNFGEFICCLGASLNPLGFMGEKNKEKGFSTSMGLTPALGGAVLGLCVVIAGVWLFMTYTPYQEAVHKNKVLRQQVDELSTSVTAYREYTSTKQAYEYIVELDQSPELVTQYVVDFIEELETKMPHSFFITNLSFSTGGFGFDVTVNTKQEAAEVIEQLRTFELIQSFAVDSIYDEKILFEDGTILAEDGTPVTVKNNTSNDNNGEATKKSALEGSIATQDGKVTFTVVGSLKMPHSDEELAETQEQAQ